MDIKVGEYVRTECGIAKVKNIEITDEVYELDKDIMYVHQENWKSTCSKPEIVKHSKNLIDLIEVGDIVNGYRILNIVDLDNSNKKVFTICKSDLKDICKVWGEEDIETILTKEQMETNCYKVR